MRTRLARVALWPFDAMEWLCQHRHHLLVVLLMAALCQTYHLLVLMVVVMVTEVLC